MISIHRYFLKPLFLKMQKESVGKNSVVLHYAYLLNISIQFVELCCLSLYLLFPLRGMLTLVSIHPPIQLKHHCLWKSPQALLKYICRIDSIFLCASLCLLMLAVLLSKWQIPWGQRQCLIRYLIFIYWLFLALQ